MSGSLFEAPSLFYCGLRNQISMKVSFSCEMESGWWESWEGIIFITVPQSVRCMSCCFVCLCTSQQLFASLLDGSTTPAEGAGMLGRDAVCVLYAWPFDTNCCVSLAFLRNGWSHLFSNISEDVNPQHRCCEWHKSRTYQAVHPK